MSTEHMRTGSTESRTTGQHAAGSSATTPTTTPATPATTPATPATPPATPATPPATPAATPRAGGEGGTVEARRATPYYADRARLASYRRTAPRPPAAQGGAWIALLVCVSVLYAQWGLYPQSARAQTDANWALGFMIASTAAALRILMGNPGRHLVSAGTLLASGVGFVLLAFLVNGEPTDLLAFEAVCGALLLLGGLMTAASPMLTVDPPAPDHRG